MPTTGSVPEESTRSEDKVASTLSTNGIIPHESTRSEDNVASTLPDVVDTAPVYSRTKVATPKVEPSPLKSKPLIIGMNVGSDQSHYFSHCNLYQSRGLSVFLSLSLSLSFCLNAFAQFSRYWAETLQVGRGQHGPGRGRIKKFESARGGGGGGHTHNNLTLWRPGQRRAAQLVLI